MTTDLMSAAAVVVKVREVQQPEVLEGIFQAEPEVREELEQTEGMAEQEEMTHLPVQLAQPQGVEEEVPVHRMILEEEAHAEKL